MKGRTEERRNRMEYKITLKAARVNAGLTLKEAAEGINVHLQTLHNWETGKTVPSIEHARALSSLYNFPLDYIFIPTKSEIIG